jgi:hypothetical protein
VITVWWELSILSDERCRDVLRVVSYGRAEPHLEKRHFSTNRDGVWQVGRARGLSRMDLEVILANVAQIARAFRREQVG